MCELGLGDATSCTVPCCAQTAEALCQRTEVFCVDLEETWARGSLWLRYAVLFVRIVENRKLKLFYWKVSTEVYPSHTEVSFCRARLSSSTRGQEVEHSGWRCRCWGPWRVIVCYQKWLSFGVGDKAWWLHKFTSLAFWLDMHLAF